MNNPQLLFGSWRAGSGESQVIVWTPHVFRHELHGVFSCHLYICSESPQKKGSKTFFSPEKDMLQAGSGHRIYIDLLEIF